MRRLTSILLTFAAALVLSLQALAVPVDQLPRPTDYVSDLAHVLSPATVERLDRICTQLDHAANAQVAIVTVPSLDGEDTADYANQLETKWKMGRKGSDRGVLILLATGDRKRRIDVGYGLEGILNDAKLGDIGRAMVPYLRQQDYDNAVLLATTQISQVVAADAHVTLDQSQPEDSTRDLQPHRVVVHRRLSPLGLLLRIALILFFIFAFARSPFLRGMIFGSILSSIFGGGGGGYRNDRNDRGGSGFGGFGGGDFGGGGAGGDW